MGHYWYHFFFTVYGFLIFCIFIKIMALFDFLCYIKLVIYIPFLFSTLRTINLMGQFKFRFCQKGIILKMRLYVKKTKHANFKKLWLDSSRRHKKLQA